MITPNPIHLKTLSHRVPRLSLRAKWKQKQNEKLGRCGIVIRASGSDWA
ncbi:hypothetical protein Q31a_48180 [Aureliella helgolandensis]|uniref:Uncharacterized protein n=1 Tax=Aureliella helgolandensis TaxID=2527968 RepID=A0A518GCW9_9BACT|nr:hypothetical protein Q31a_48180 [Aureliella helgolandensis]